MWKRRVQKVEDNEKHKKTLNYLRWKLTRKKMQAENFKSCESLSKKGERILTKNVRSEKKVKRRKRWSDGEWKKWKRKEEKEPDPIYGFFRLFMCASLDQVWFLGNEDKYCPLFLDDDRKGEKEILQDLSFVLFFPWWQSDWFRKSWSMRHVFFGGLSNVPRGVLGHLIFFLFHLFSFHFLLVNYVTPPSFFDILAFPKESGAPECQDALCTSQFILGLMEPRKS